jgi:hypothetical protein
VDDRGFLVLLPGGAIDFIPVNHPDWLLGATQSPTQWVAGTLSSGLKELGHECDH